MSKFLMWDFVFFVTWNIYWVIINIIIINIIIYSFESFLYQNLNYI